MRKAAKIVLLLLAVMPLSGWAKSARVLAVFPSGPIVPANLLRISITFDHRPARPVLPRLTLAGASLAPGQAPFLDQELWTPDERTVTVLFDPARLKTGLVANRQFGRVLRTGDIVVLKLGEYKLKRWRVGPPLNRGPAPQHWIIDEPRARTRMPILINLRHPIDWLDQALIAVVAPDGSVVAGATALANGGKQWRFTPAHLWAQGEYRLAVSPELEDPSGNAVGQSFEFKGQIVPPSDQQPVFLAFQIR